MVKLGSRGLLYPLTQLEGQDLVSFKTGSHLALSDLELTLETRLAGNSRDRPASASSETEDTEAKQESPDRHSLDTQTFGWRLAPFWTSLLRPRQLFAEDGDITTHQKSHSPHSCPHVLVYNFFFF